MKNFVFKSCYQITELLGRRADNELKLMELMEEVPLDSIYYHMHTFYFKHSDYNIGGPYPNDFANWTSIQLRDRVLGEKLASVTPLQKMRMEDVRNILVEILDEHLSELGSIPTLTHGQPFYFMKSCIVDVPTGISVKTLKDFRNTIKAIDASVIYFHIFDARLRSGKGVSDFASWIGNNLQLTDLAQKIENIDCYMYNLEGLRAKLLLLCDEEMSK
ncbi:MAG: DUF5752 family protein [Elusimicrobiota bacterium]